MNEQQFLEISKLIKESCIKNYLYLSLDISMSHHGFKDDESYYEFSLWVDNRKDGGYTKSFLNINECINFIKQLDSNYE